MKTKILLVDDHTMLREGLAAILKQIEYIEVVGSLSSGEEAVNLLDQYQPDVILMDIIMAGMTGLEATRWVKEQSPKTKVVIISSEIKKEFVSEGIKCGIDGYIPKNSNKQEILEAIKAVTQGEKFFNKAITNLIFEDFYNTEKDGKESSKRLKTSTQVTKRENEVLRLAADGKSNQEIADELFISIKTVETHKMNILEKLGLKNTAELVKYAIKHNIISIE